MSEREALEALWQELHGGKETIWCRWYGEKELAAQAYTFTRMLDAGAYLDAAAMRNAALEEAAQFVERWNGDTRDGDTFLIASELRALKEQQP